MLHPRNIVLVGATDKPGNYAERIWNNLIKYKYEGGLFPVNAKRETIWGVPCYKDFASLPEKPDHVLVLVPARFAVQVIRDAAAAGARSATIVTSGFSELQDEDSQRLAVELKEAVRETGLAVTGPNCLGNLSAGEKLFTNIDDRIVTMEAGPVAIAGQSGAIVMAIRQTLEDRGVGVGYMVTTGNETGLETPDLMAYFAADPSIRVIVVYLEGVRNTKVFREACKAARAAGKPVIALKLGASEGGRAAAMAHTGALAGSIETFDAISTREGVIRVRGLDELIETTECFVHAEPPKSNRLAAVSLSGGKRGLLIDAFYSAGLNFAPLSPNATEQLAKMLGPGSIVGNPLDAGFAAVVDPSVYMNSIKIMIDDPDTDIVIIDAELPKAPHELRERNLRIVNEMAGAASKPVVYISAMSIGFTEFTKALRKSLPNIAVMQGLDRAVGAIKSLIEYSSPAQGSAGHQIEFEGFGARGAGEGAQERQWRRGARRGRLEEAAQGLWHSRFKGRDRADRRGSGEDRQEDRLSRRGQSGQRRHPAQVRHRRRGAEPQQRGRGEEGVQRHHRAGQEDQEQAEARRHSDRAAGQGRP